MKHRIMSLFLFLQTLPTLCQVRPASLQAAPDGQDALVLTVRSNYPIRDSVRYLNENYGWLISYEDPIYPDVEVEDISIPQWKKAHPGERGFLTPIFSQVRFRITKPSGSKGEQEKILGELVDQFNRLGRQDTFIVIPKPQNRGVVVGSVNGREALQAAVVGPETRIRTEAEELRLLLEGCSARTQIPLVAGTIIANRNLTLPPRKAVVPCRDALLAVAIQGGANLVYQILEDVNNKTYVVNIGPSKVIVQQSQ